MDGYLTDPFIKKLPANLKASWLPGNSAFSDFYKSVSRGAMQIAVSDEHFVIFLENLKKDEPELAKALISLESSGKLQAVYVDSSIPVELNISGIRNSNKRQISGGYKIPADLIFHEAFDDPKSRDKIVDTTKKPLILEIDLTDGTTEYLFRERSFSLNIGETFNWARFINQYVLPFNYIRILDPYLYKNISNIDLKGLISALTKKNTEVSIDIISNGEQHQIERVKEELLSIDGFKADLRLYKQASDVSNTFHKRVIWTDYWILFAERGFDFLIMQKGLGKVKKETNLYLTGKYASRKSIWHQIDNNWQDYLVKAELIQV